MERIQLHLVHGTTRVRAWRSAPPQSWRCRFVTVGYLSDGAWFAEHTGLHGGAFLCADEAAADRLADGWRQLGEWWETPAAFGPDAQPLEDGWVQRGGSWFRE